MAGLALSDKPELASQILALRAAGATQAVIASKLACSQQSVSEALARPDMKARLQLAHEALLNAALDPAIDNVSHLVSNYRQLEPGQEKEHAYKATIKVLETVGIAPTHAPSIYVTNVLHADQVVLSPVVQQVVQSVTGQLAIAPESELEVLDVEPE